ncbi:carbohydrate esterase family 12 protein [Xylaria bambusicola]|uniref:carbohydrate esterase family 12 protein n=1 Tax=Xylaria bambusicola TaxID=326684 RepID=UPI00200877A5|nr:carbohydrate esterase family 12 protein [Xylaria bambusicola]KAI0528227.1 carbohydrate esterase family 12 protein [Xylaria bambusicola]
MRLSSLATILALGALQAVATPTQPDLAPRATPTVYLCGDSTMANRGANDGATDGWGQYFGTYSTVTVVNKAIGGRSARSYWNEGRFQEVANLVKSGDIVVIEFGHNDGGSPRSNDNGRSACPGTGTETCTSDKTGEVVYTFVFYVIQAAKLMTAKGATVILSSQTPNNLWETGTFVGGAPRFVGYQLTAQKALSSSSVTFVDHFQAVANTYQKIGNSATNALYPRDHTHTSPQGASLVAQAFTQAIYQSMNGTTSLKNYIKNPPTVY